MALRDQPYLPLYVQDYLTDEKLRECSADSVGVFSFMMCVLHKQEEYGVILLEQNDKQSESISLNFAKKLAKHLPYESDLIKKCLDELINKKVLRINGDNPDKLYQKRMIEDNRISEIRARAGSKGGQKAQLARAKPEASAKAKIVANSENEIENEIENESSKIISRFLSVFNRQPQEHEMLFFNQMSLRLPEKVILDFINDFVEYRDQQGKFNWKYFQGYFRGRMKDYEAEAEKVEKQKEMIQSAKDRKLSAEQQLEASKQLELDTWTTFKEAKLSETHRKLILPMIQNKKFLQALSRIQELRTDK